MLRNATKYYEMIWGCLRNSMMKLANREVVMCQEYHIDMLSKQESKQASQHVLFLIVCLETKSFCCYVLDSGIA